MVHFFYPVPPSPSPGLWLCRLSRSTGVLGGTAYAPVRLTPHRGVTGRRLALTSSMSASDFQAASEQVIIVKARY